jgi:cleavage and polyadenylation specificity factor subunit 2
MFHFTALLGAQSESGASQSLLQLDNGIKILVDVGWDANFDVRMLDELERHTPTIDLILLTHPTLEHMGAYAHACKHIRNFSMIPVYSTFPVSNLGRLLLQDIYLSSPKAYTRLLDTSIGHDASSIINPITTPISTGTPMPVDPNIILGPTAVATEVPKDALKLPPTPAEIDSYCGKIITLKYSQPTPLHSAVSRVAGKLGSITITAYSAGHSLGGTIWKIQQAQESIVYAVDWNLSRENCLRGAAFLGEGGRVQDALLKPTALVCSSRNATVTNVAGGRKKRDEVLLETIHKVAVEKGGTVLIPTDSVGRVLELAYLLEHAWRKDQTFSGKGKGKGVGLYLAGRKVKRLSQVVGSMLEWMDEAVVREFESITEKSSQNRNIRRAGGGGGGGSVGNKDQDSKDGKSDPSGNKAGPFDFTYLTLISTPGQLTKILNHNAGMGKVLIASDSSLEWGFSRDALIKLASDDKNIVVLTERGEGKVGLTGQLWQGWKEAVSTYEEEDSAATGQIVAVHSQHEIKASSKIWLEGDELIAYKKYMAAQQMINSQHQSLMSTSGLPSGLDVDVDDEDASSSSDDDSDSERQGKALTASKKVSQAAVMMGGAVPLGINEKTVDIGINILLRGEGVYDFDVRGAKGRNRMFPFQIRRRRVDEYGEVVRPDDYLRAEERQDEEELVDDAGEQQATRVMGKKRKWNEDILKPGRGVNARKGHKEGEDNYPKITSHKRRSGSHQKQHHNHRRRRAADKSTNDDEDSYDPEAQESNEEGELSESSSSILSESEDDAEEGLTSPCKLPPATASTIHLRISATFIDFMGLHDQKSLRMLLPLIDPKKLILIGGKRDETKYLAEFYREKVALTSRAGGGGCTGNTDVFSPRCGNTVNASVDTNAWTVKLGNSLSRGLKWQNVRGLGVVHVFGRVAPDEHELQQKKQKTTTVITTFPTTSSMDLDDQEQTNSNGIQEVAVVEKHQNQLILDVLPPALAAATRSVAQPIHVGDIRLADLRRLLQDEGHVAEFKGEGTLLVDGVVVVRKTGVGNVAVEDGGGGLLSTTGAGAGEFRDARGNTFIQVRRKVYEGLAVVAGG